MLKEYPKFKRNEIETIFDKLPKHEKDIIKDYLEYRRARGITSEPKIADIRRYLIQLRVIIEKDYNNIDLKDLRSFLSVITQSQLSDNTKNNLKIDIKNFMRYLFKDWSMRFNDFDDIKTHSVTNEKKINAQNIFKKEDIEKLVKFENKNYWKAFLLTQYEGALRTKEVRFLKWNDVKFNVDGEISEINIYSTKTKKARVVFLEKSTFYLKKLKEEQENNGIKSVYIFPSNKNINNPVDKGAVSLWFRRLTLKALGREGWNYLLRHSRATELYRLAERGQISKDTAIRFMGHSEDMTKTYTHLDTKEIKQMLKDQVYHLEDLPEEKKHDLKLMIEKQNKEIEELRKRISKFENKEYMDQQVKQQILKILSEEQKKTIIKVKEKI